MSAMCVRLLTITLELYVTSGSAYPKTSIATSLVSARLDYCNAIFYGTLRNNVDKLQHVQNTLVRVVMSVVNTII